MKSRAVTRANLGAWLIKTNPAVTPVAELLRTGFRTVTSRCVTPSYRTELIKPGQPVLLWVSGSDPRAPAGIYAQGRTTGRPTAGLAMPIELEPVNPPILRTELVEHPVLAQIEVLRMPAASNPSFITGEHWRELVLRWPHVQVD